MAERGEEHRSAVGYLALIKRIVILTRGIVNNGMIGIAGLNDRPALLSRASGSADELRHHRKCTLTRSEVLKIQRGIRKNDSGHVDGREIVSLSDHLRTEQNIVLVRAKALEHIVKRVLCRGGVRIHPKYARGRITRFKLLLHTLNAESDTSHMLAAA